MFPDATAVQNAGHANSTPAQADTDAAVAKARQAQRRTIIATSVGNGLEMYDFTVFSFFAAQIGRNFFPTDSASGSLLLAMATFGVGFVMRPLGGLIIGNYADRAGRRAALSLTILLMMAGTALIALTPGYATIGIAAPAFVVLGRLLQGLSAGGEVGAATTFLMESAPTSKRGFMVSWQAISQGSAAVLGALSGALLSATLTPEQLDSWGWRIPFLAGLLIGPVGLYIRRNLDETFEAQERKESAFKEVLHNHLGRVILGAMTLIGGTSMLYILVFYMPSYAARVLKLPTTTSFLAGCASGLTMIVFSTISGLWIIDRLNRRKPLVMATTAISVACVYPAFWLINQSPSVGLLLGIVVVVMGVTSLSSSAFFLLYLEAFPKRVRATALSIIYSFGVTIFGGFAQFNVTWLMARTGDPMSPAWYLIACGLVSILALCVFAERPANTAAH